MATNVEIYEALRPTVGEEAARMIAEALPSAAHAATKGDIDEVRVDIRGMEARIFRWMLGFFATLWLSNAGMIVTLLLRR